MFFNRVPVVSRKSHTIKSTSTVCGYRAFGLFPYGADELDGITYPTYDECLSQALHNHPYEEIGVDYCKDEDGCITVLKRVKTPTKELYADE